MESRQAKLQKPAPSLHQQETEDKRKAEVKQTQATHTNRRSDHIEQISEKLSCKGQVIDCGVHEQFCRACPTTTGIRSDR
jgi:hypothetical protein